MSTPVQPNAVCGKRIDTVFVADAGEEYPCQSLVPDDQHLFNFEVEAGGHTWLVLDNYGNEYLTEEFEIRILAVPRAGYTLAIDKATGELWLALFETDGANVGLTLSALTVKCDMLPLVHLRLPHKYLEKVDTLKNKKRPFSIELHGRDLIMFIDREIGFDRLHDEAYVEFHFDDGLVQVWGEHYRVVSLWEDVGRIKTPKKAKPKSKR